MAVPYRPLFQGVHPIHTADRPRRRGRCPTRAAEAVLLARQRLPRPATIDDLIIDLDTAAPGPEQVRLLRAVREFDSYIRANAGRIPNYGERYRAGEVISTAFTESAVNEVISKPMVKKQQRRWTPRGAHLLLQVRIRVLNGQLVGGFHCWYPGLRRTPDPMTPAA